MTTRAGFAGLLTGLLTTLIIYPLFMASPDVFLDGHTAGSTPLVWIVAAAVVILMVGAGFVAARWSGSAHTGRCAALGGLAGGLAGTIIFCLWGAAAAGSARWVFTAGETISQAEIIAAIVRQTMGIFLMLFLGGCSLGAQGGMLACSRAPRREDVFDKTEPQMALNMSITALPASIVAAVLAAAIFSRLSDLPGRQAGQTAVRASIADLPLVVSLLLVLISHVAVTQVVPHETRQSEHLCGMEEVKMAAFVGIGAAPLLIMLLLLVDANCFTNPLVVAALLASTSMSLISLRSLFRLVLPKRASFPPHQEGRQKTEARWFGSIANSQGPRLVELCIGCGMLMVLPLYISVLAVLVNLTSVLDSSAFVFIPAGMWKLYQTQALVSSGVVTVSIGVLTIIYLFYLNLGRWFSKWNSRHQD